MSEQIKKLIVSQDNKEIYTKEIVLNKSLMISIGRNSDNDIFLNERVISGTHAFVLVDFSGNVQIKDNNSKNGTEINGRKLEGGKLYPIKTGDLITFANLQNIKLFIQVENKPSTISTKIESPIVTPQKNEENTQPIDIRNIPVVEKPIIKEETAPVHEVIEKIQIKTEEKSINKQEISSQEKVFTETEEIDWSVLVNSIKNERCLLFLGSGVTVNYHNPNNQLEAFSKIANDCKIKLHKPDLFFDLFKSTAAAIQLKCRNKVVEFYNSINTNTLIEKIAEIPFHIIISTTPDITLNKYFEQKNFINTPYYYNHSTKEKVELSPSANNPLIYNLLGSLKDEQNLIFTHNSLLEYLESFFKNEFLSNNNHFTENKKGKIDSAIFLGFEFDNWFFQLILYLFELQIDKKNAALYSNAPNKKNNLDENIYKDIYKIQFADKDLDNFVNELHSKFSKDELRKPSKIVIDKEIEYIKKLLTEGNIKEALVKFKEKVKKIGDTELENKIIIIEQNNNRNEQSKSISITTETYNVERTKIIQAILRICEEIN